MILWPFVTRSKYNRAVCDAFCWQKEWEKIANRQFDLIDEIHALKNQVLDLQPARDARGKFKRKS